MNFSGNTWRYLLLAVAAILLIVIGFKLANAAATSAAITCPHPTTNTGT